MWCKDQHKVVGDFESVGLKPHTPIRIILHQTSVRFFTRQSHNVMWSGPYDHTAGRSSNQINLLGGALNTSPLFLS
jgi:hypothetical protein